MFRSLRWTLQLWHALLLVVVLLSFGAVLYFQVRSARLDSIDAELTSAAHVIAAALRGPGPPHLRGSELSPPAPPVPGEPTRERDGGRPDRGRPDGPRRPRSPEPWMERIELPPGILRQYEDDRRDGAYFVVWRPDGQPVAMSSLPESVDDPPFEAEPPRGHAPALIRQRGPLREAILPTPAGLRILVGRSIARELGELRQLLWMLSVTGMGVLALGLGGGWILARRAIAPIQSISETAQSISATNLSRRIDIGRTQSELGQLAHVLNDAFTRLEAAFERQTRFTADASHELRTPLTVIYSNAELALSRDRSAEEYRRTLEACFKAARRMKELVESLLVLARADAGKLEMKREPLDLAHAAADCIALIQPLAAERSINVSADLKEAPVLADPFRLAQVITNLLTNAVRYNRDGGSIHVATTVEGAQSLLTVADTGIGISEEDQKHLFDRFFRVDKARSRELGGSGLGLTICRSIVEAHGGTIAFASRPDEGTTFTVRLPLASRT